MAERDNSSLDTAKPGIFYGYFIVTAVFFVILVCSGTLYTFGVFFKPLLAEFGWTRVMTSGAFSLYSVLTGSLSIVMGNLTDRFGPRLVLTWAGLLSGIGYILMSQVNAIWQLYLFYGVIVAIGMSGGIIPALSLVARWFTKRRAMMTGIAMAGMGLGPLIMPPLANWLITTYGWRTAYVILGMLPLVLITTAGQFLKRDPAQIGLLPYGANELHRGAEEDSVNLELIGFSLRQAVLTRQFYLVCVLSFFSSFSISMVMVHIVIAATGLGISTANAVIILSIAGGLTFTGRLILGSVTDRMGNIRVLLFGFSLMALAFLWLSFAKELWMFFLFAAAFGFATGCWVAVPPLLGKLFGMISHGALIGFAFFSSNLGNTIGPVLAGYIFDTTGSYRLAWYIAATAAILSIIIILLIKQAGNPVPVNDGERKP